MGDEPRRAGACVDDPDATAAAHRDRRPVRTELDDRRLTPDVDRPQEPPTRRLEDPHVPVLAPLGEPLAVRAVRDLRPPEGKRLPADARHPGLKR